MIYNLVMEPWIPVRKADGTLDRIAPWQIGEDDVTCVAVPRPDFEAAITQWLIGLVQTCLTPRTLEDWNFHRDTPPFTGELESRMKAMRTAFGLHNGSSPFMQDATSEQGKLYPITDLLIETPTGQMVQKNADLFVKRRPQGQLCPPCAAMAIYTLQSNAPEGGRGHNTSVRGGGPITTLVEGDTLWKTVWNNVLIASELDRMKGDPRLVAPEHIFPWMGDLRQGGKTGHATTPEHGNPLMVYWATPRRLLLGPTDRDGPCFVCGETGEDRISSYRSMPNGFQYRGWVHPLTPHRAGSQDPISLKGGKGSMTVRDWLGWVQDDHEGERTPALAVESYVNDKANPEDSPARLWCSGYWTDQSTVVHWQEARMPLAFAKKNQRKWFQEQCKNMVAGAQVVQKVMAICVKQSLFHPRLTIKGDIGCLFDDFWFRISDGFFTQQRKLLKRPSNPEEERAAITQWYDLCCKEGKRLYQIYVCAYKSRETQSPPEPIDTKKLDQMLESDTVLAAFGLRPAPEVQERGNMGRRQPWTHGSKNAYMHPHRSPKIKGGE